MTTAWRRTVADVLSRRTFSLTATAGRHSRPPSPQHQFACALHSVFSPTCTPFRDRSTENVRNKNETRSAFLQTYPLRPSRRLWPIKILISLIERKTFTLQPLEVGSAESITTSQRRTCQAFQLSFNDLKSDMIFLHTSLRPTYQTVLVPLITYIHSKTRGDTQKHS
jgi:hypothetical protein